MREQSVGECGGGESFAGAGRHLDKRAGMVSRQRCFDGVGRLDLAVAEALAVQGRHGLELAPQRPGLLQPSRERRRTMEGENPTRDRRRVGMVAKQDLGRRGDVFKADLPGFPDQILGRAGHVALCLHGEAG